MLKRDYNRKHNPHTFRLSSKLLNVTPMNDEELTRKRDNENDPHMRAAYTQMLEGCLGEPHERLWYTAWNITLPDGTTVGDLCFKGKPGETHTVEIGYGITESFESHGFATEAVRLVCDWALAQKGCYFVIAEVEDGNRASERVLEKNGFTRFSEGDEGHIWRRERAASSYAAIMMCLGLAVSILIGFAVGHTALFICAGLILGLMIGVLLDGADMKMRTHLPQASTDKKAGDGK